MAPPPRPAPTRVKSRRLSRAQMLELYEYSLVHRSMDKRELAIWATDHFRLGLPLGERAVDRILSKYDELGKITRGQLHHTAKPDVTQSRVDTELRDWVQALHDQGQRVDGAMIKSEAARIHAQLRQTEEGRRGRKPTFSNGWLSSFLERHGISLRGTEEGGELLVSEGKKATTAQNKPTAQKATKASRVRVSLSGGSATSPPDDE